MNIAKTLVIPGITDPATLACIARSRKFPQYKKAIEDALAGRCPFCQLDTKYNKPVKVSCTRRLRVWHCNPPEKHTKYHFIISPNRHVTDTLHLLEDEWSEVQNVVCYLRALFNFDYCGILIRDGDATQSAGTVQHLHIHVMVPDGTGRVESPFCKTPEEEAAGVARAIVFEKLRTGFAFKGLIPEEQKLVQGRLE